MHALERALQANLTRRCGVVPGQKGLVAVSGGADSLALLLGLAALRRRLRLRLEVVHFDHGLRPESGREAAWVQEQAERAGLRYHLRVNTRLKEQPHGVQAAAREWRRTELLKLRESTQADWIATGHQQGDHLETLLLKLLRGAHLSRLHGMEWRSTPFVRPLLDQPRSALEGYLRGMGREWLTDPSNASPKYKRNRVRQELLPLLDELAGGAIAKRLLTLEGQSRALAAWLGSLPTPKQGPDAASPPWLDVTSLLKLPPLVQAFALERFIQSHAPGDLSADDVEHALSLLHIAHGPSRQRWSLDLPQGRTLRRKGGRMDLHVDGGATGTAVHQLDDVTVEAPASWAVAGGRGGSASAGLRLAGLPVGARLVVRARLPGDRFQPAWRTGPVKVKDFLRDQHVPLWERDRVPVVLLNGVPIALYPRFVNRAHGSEGPTSGSNAPQAFTLQLTVPE